MEPPISLPNSIALIPDATAAAPPPVLPPGVYAGFQGFKLRPKSGLTVCQSLLAIGVLVFPMITPPLILTICVNMASSPAIQFSGLMIPPVVGIPFTWMASFIVIGKPASGLLSRLSEC